MAAGAKRPRPLAEPALRPRLVGVEAAAGYLGVKGSTLRQLVAAGHVAPVVLPSCRHPGESGRRLLFDVRDLDAFVDSLKVSA